MRKKDVEEFLRNIRKANPKVYDSPGLGQSVRITKDAFLGSCLVYRDEAVHLSLFQRRRESKRGRDYIAKIITPMDRLREI